MIKNIFDQEICVDCGQECHAGSGRFVNRYAYYGDEIEDGDVVIVQKNLTHY